MSQIYYFPKESSTCSLRVCRGCLATDARLYDMRQDRLMEAYNTLLSTAMQVTDDLPLFLCSYCAVFVLKCETFRIKCIDNQAALRHVQLEKSELTLEHIKQLDRPMHYKQSYMQTLNINEENDIHLPESTYIAEYFIEDIKTEVDIDTDCTENIEDNFKLIPDTKDSTDILNIIENTVSNKAKLKFEEIADCKSSIKDAKTLISEETDDSDFEVSSRASSSDTDDDFEVDFTPKRKRGAPKDKVQNKKKCSPRTKETDTKKKANSNVRTKLPDNFGDMYNVELVHLDREEQLKEIEDRKESDNYQQGHFKCNICYKGFVVEESYNNHMLLHDDISGTEVCDVCHCHFMNKKQLSKHKDHHKRRFTCKECGHATQYIAKAKQHYKWHKGLKFKCKHCGKEFKGLTSHFTHLKMLHPTSDQLVRCELCGDSFTGTTGLKSHENRAHKEQMTSPEYYCSTCDNQFYCSDAFKAHQGTDGLCDTLHKYCVRCGMSFETEELLKEHEIEQRKPRDVFECEVCHKRYSNFISYKTHRRRHSPFPRPKREANQPKRAGPKEHGPKAKRPKGKPEDKAIVRISTICEICGKVLKNRSFLKLHHVMSHTDLKPHKCNECPKKFRSSMNLKVHMRTHTGERPYQCEHCPKAFQNIGNLKRHNLVHTGERPHTCELCGKSFQTKDCVQTHVKTVHMKIPMPPRIRRRNKKIE